jgi:hypothetical protein
VVAIQSEYSFAEEIALAIISEIQSVMKQRDGRPLKDKVLVHERTQILRALTEETETC